MPTRQHVKVPLGRVAAGAAVALPLMWLVFADAVVNVTHSDNPALALRFDASDPVALTRWGHLRVSQLGMNGDEEGEVVDAARESLKRLTLNASALELLAAVGGGQDGEARQQFSLADRLSRRDVSVQIAMMQQAILEGDIATALQHYDAALRIDNGSRGFLFQVMSFALRDPGLSEYFVPYIREPAPWLGAFVRYILNSSIPVDNTVMAAIEAGGFPKTEEFTGLNKELIRRLEAGDKLDIARRFYLTLDGADANTLRSLELSSASTDARFAPITWQPFNIAGMDASIVSSAAGNLEIRAQVEPGSAGTLARKIVQLPPGSYAFESSQRAARGGPTMMEWSISCAGDGPSLWNEQARVGTEPTTVRGAFTVPENCTFQVATVSTSVSISEPAAEIVVGSVGLRKTR